MAKLQFTLEVDGLSDDSLVVTEYQGQDNFSSVQQSDGTWCHGFRYQIQLASHRPDLTALDFVDKTAELIMMRDGEIVQRIHGIVRNFTQAETGHHHTFYAIALVPEIERLSLRHNSRIFQLANACEIIQQLLLEMDIQDFAFAIMRTPELREFCMQYRESDLDFINRLMAEEGLVYHIEHGAGKHTVVFSDNSQTLPKLGQPIPYNALSGGHSQTPYINAFSKTTQFDVSEAVTGDSSFKKPTYTFSQSQVGTDMEYQRQDSYQHYDTPGRYKDDRIGKVFNQYRIESLRRSAHTAQGTSDESQLQAGSKFDLQEHTDDSVNRDWLIIAATHQGTQPQSLEQAAGSQPTTYANQFKAIPADKNWRMPQITKPRVEGPMTAYVVGPSGEEIFCDDMGRVKLHFPWDRYSNGDETSSCWIHVSQGWAGSQYGQIAIPRIGQQVIVSFLDGDPDQPIVTGRVYNATHKPPYTLPEHKTKTVWRSETHQGQGFNEISFEDQTEQEQIYLHAQKDFKAEIQHDHITDINHDQHLTVENDQFTHIKQHQNLTVEGESRTRVAKNQTLIVDGDLHIKSGSVLVNESGKEIHIKAGQKVVVEAAAELTVKVASSFLKVDPAGVHIVGSVVNMNSGGRAGSGSGFSGSIPTLPNGISPIAAPKPAPITDFHALLKADKSKLKVVKVCTLALEENQSVGALAIQQAESQDLQQHQMILQSSLLRPSEALNLLALGRTSAYKNGMKGSEIEVIQRALMQLGFNLGKFGADGDFGNTTEKQVKLFQKNYKPSHAVHENYNLGGVDGIVGKGTILGLDEAMVDKWSTKREKHYNWADSEFGLLLGSVESKNDYSAYNRTKGGLRSFFNTNITNLTIRDIQINQANRNMFAVGRFQLIPSTLNEAVIYLNIDIDDVFDKKVQDYIFNSYLISVKRPQIIDYLESDGAVEDAMYAWAKEFASAGVEKGRYISKNRVAVGGESYYAGDGLNKAHLSPEQIKIVLVKSRIEALK